MREWGRLYKVREDDDFQKYVATLVGDYELWDKIQSTIDMDLAARPQLGKLIEQIGPNRYLYGIIIPYYPELVLYYIVDDDQNELVLYELAWV